MPAFDVQGPENA